MDRLLTLRALAKRLAVSQSRLRAWIDSGEFPPPVVLPDGAERWRLSSVQAWLADLLPAGHGQHDEDAGEVVAAAEQIDPTTLSELALEILQALSESSQDWLQYAEAATKIGGDADPKAGSWGRAIKQLKEAGLVRTHQARGVSLCDGVLARIKTLLGGETE